MTHWWLLKLSLFDANRLPKILPMPLVLTTTDILIGCATLMLVLATLVPLSRQSHWMVRGLDFPRIQFAAIAITLLLCQILFLDLHLWSTQVMITVALFCFAWQLWWILPYTILWPTEVKNTANLGDPTLSVLTANVLAPNRKANLLIDLVHQHQPDILVTLESDQWWQDQLDVLEKDMPHTVKCPLDNLYGMHVYSRIPLQESEICYLVEEDIPSIHASIEIHTGVQVAVHFLHPAPPSPTENEKSEERDAELITVARRVADSDQPILVTGDLNDVAWSPTTRLFRKISGLLDPRIGRGAFNTFHVSIPFVRWPLDHMFHSHHFLLKELRRLPSIGSDHFPLLARLSYSPSEGSQQESLSATDQDEQRAVQISSKQNVEISDVPQPNKR